MTENADRLERRSVSIDLDRVRTRLVIVWFLGVTLVFLLLIVQTVGGRYPRDKIVESWAWLLPNTMPTLTLMVTVLGTAALRPKTGNVSVRRDFSRLASFLSGVYLLLVLATLLVEPLTPLERSELLSISNFWLGPIQGLVAAVTGALFFTSSIAQ